LFSKSDLFLKKKGLSHGGFNVLFKKKGSIQSVIKVLAVLGSNRIELNISVGRDLQRSSSPTAWPLQGWPKFKACY